jgi:glutamine synthetase
VNWSLATAEGVNLLNPGDKPHENVRFLYFLAATLKAVHDNAELLRASVAPAGNEFRMGANEAPPAIISAFLGDALSEVVEKIASNSTGSLSERAKTIDMELAKVPEIAKDNTDRNRTSPFAFTGNKFEFRACGASQSVSDPTYFLNTAVAESLRQMNVRLRTLSATPDHKTVLAVIAETFKGAKAIQFDGDGYSKEWHQEAEKRGLAHNRTTPASLAALLKPSVKKMFADHNVMTEGETEARYNVFIERYNKIRLIELETMNELLLSQVYPAAIEQQILLSTALKAAKEITGSFPSVQLESYKTLVSKTDRLLVEIAALGKVMEVAKGTHDETKAATFLADKAVPAMAQARSLASELEECIDDTLWPLPKYRELLHIS